jgi:molybdenum cofactor cytidylyltransferase
MTVGPIVGVLLAAGRSTRFGSDKLLVPLEDGTPIGVAALKNLAAAVDAVVAVVRPGDAVLAAALAAHGARVTECPNAAEGMGESLAWGVRGSPTAAARLIALADKPWMRPAAIERVVGALRRGAPIAAPGWQGRQGHPVGFAALHYPELIALSGDLGARPVIERHGVLLVEAEDSGVVRDVDAPQDLVR